MNRAHDKLFVRSLGVKDSLRLAHVQLYSNSSDRKRRLPPHTVMAQPQSLTDTSNRTPGRTLGLPWAGNLII